MTPVPDPPADHPVLVNGVADWELCIRPDCPGPPAAWRWFPPTSNGDPAGWYPVCRKHARGRVAWPTPAQCEAAGQPYRRPTAKPKGPNRTQLRAKCDRLFAEHIRSHGQCEAEGVGPGDKIIQCSDRLQCAHIISRKEFGVRWDPANALCLCSAHHSWFTREPLRWEMWRDSYVGDYAALRTRALAYVGPPDYSKVLAELEMLGGIALAHKHMDHYRSCECLGDSAECCVPSCECHVGERRNA